MTSLYIFFERKHTNSDCSFVNRWLPTENGQNFADTIGFPAPTGSLEESVKGMIEQVRF